MKRTKKNKAKELSMFERECRMPISKQPSIRSTSTSGLFLALLPLTNVHEVSDDDNQNKIPRRHPVKIKTGQ